MFLTRRPVLKSINNLIRRELYSAKYSTNTYEGDGKTKVSILNQEIDGGLLIDSYSRVGFRLNNGMNIVGPMAIFPKSVLSWNVASYKDITEESLSLFYALDPKIDVLVVGIGDQMLTQEFSKQIIGYMRKHKINVEILNTDKACATFNFLNSERRMVAAALIPPYSIAVNESDLLRSHVRHKLWQVED